MKLRMGHRLLPLDERQQVFPLDADVAAEADGWEQSLGDQVVDGPFANPEFAAGLLFCAS